MPKDDGLTKAEFDALLSWFSTDREEAGLKYVQIKEGLVRYFSFKGCSESEVLADETINRVARKLSAFDLNNDHKHITYFYGFAANIYREYLKKPEPKEVELTENLYPLRYNADDVESYEEKQGCLEKCLGKMSADESVIVIDYFSKEKSAKFEHRRKLAEKNNLTINALHVKIHRMKSTLRTCVENCLKGK